MAYSENFLAVSMEGFSEFLVHGEGRSRELTGGVDRRETQRSHHTASMAGELDLSFASRDAYVGLLKTSKGQSDVVTTEPEGVGDRTLEGLLTGITRHVVQIAAIRGVGIL